MGIRDEKAGEIWSSGSLKTIIQEQKQSVPRPGEKQYERISELLEFGLA